MPAPSRPQSPSESTPRSLLGARAVSVSLAVVALFACEPKGELEQPAPAPAPAVDTSAQELEARLDYLGEQLELARVRGHVPGMAVAVVRDDELIYAEGFGVTDLDANTPATAETVFAIGSSTKAFSSTLAAMMVDEGKLGWDDPASQHLEGFELAIEVKDAEEKGQVATIRDLLAHRTGFTRMGILWAGGKVPRAEVLRYATQAKPVAPFRDRFLYNNVTYMAGSMTAVQVAGTSWEELVQARLLEPLHMDHSSVDFASAMADPKRAKGYTWRPDLGEGGEFEVAPPRSTDVIAPAGSIYSSVLDMSNWLRLQLGRGEFEGQRLVSEAALAETWTKQIEISPDVDYGMGWMLREWEGHRVIEHGGNIDGYAASVAFMPDDGIGMVLLTNASMTPLQQEGMNIVWSALLTDEYEASAEGSAGGEDFGELVGEYVAEMPGFNGQNFEILVQDGKLAVDVPGQMVFTLKAPDEEGWRYFEATDTIAISFDRDADGQIMALRLHQNGMNMELLREGYELAPEVSVAEVRPYLGSYRNEDAGMSAEVLVHNGRLAVDVVGQMIYDLELPDKNGDYRFRINPDFVVTFKQGEGKREGEIVGMSIAQPGGGGVFVRVDAPAQAVTLEQLHRKRKTDRKAKALKKAGVVHLRSKVELVNAGASATADVWFDAEGRLRQDTDLGPLGSMTAVMLGEEGWSESTFSPRKQLEGLELSQTFRGHPRVLYGDWRPYFDDEALVRTEQRDGREVHVVELSHPELPTTTVYVDAKTGDAVEVHGVEVTPTGLRIPVTVKLSDYRTVKGLRLPFRSESETAPSGITVETLELVETKVGEDPARFVPMPTD